MTLYISAHFCFSSFLISMPTPDLVLFLSFVCPSLLSTVSAQHPLVFYLNSKVIIPRAETNTSTSWIFVCFDSIGMQLQLFDYLFTTTWAYWTMLNTLLYGLFVHGYRSSLSPEMLICEFFWTKILFLFLPTSYY